MADETITRQVSERYARALATGEQMCCPTSYNFEDLRRFVPEEVLGASYGCGTPVGLATVRAGETVLNIGSGGGLDCFENARLVGPSGRVGPYTRHFAVIHRAGEPVSSEAVACGFGGSCC